MFSERDSYRMQMLLGGDVAVRTVRSRHFFRRTVICFAHCSAYGPAGDKHRGMHGARRRAFRTGLSRWRAVGPSAKRGRGCRTTPHVQVGVSQRWLAGVARRERRRDTAPIVLGAPRAWRYVKRRRITAVSAAWEYRNPLLQSMQKRGVGDIAGGSGRSPMRRLVPAAARRQAPAGTARPTGSGCWTASPSPGPQPWPLPPALHSAGWFRPSGSPSG